MNDQQRMLSDMAGPLFAGLGPGATLSSGWEQVEQVALPSLLRAEADGGFGGSWEDALVVFRLAGYHALALPLVEATIAAALAGDAGRGTIAAAADGAIVAGRFTGTVSAAPWGDSAAYVIAPSPDGGGMILDVANLPAETVTSIAGEPRSSWRFDGVPVRPVAADVVALGALGRVMQIAGALDAALALSVSYANDRQQFGRPLAKFQAVQQSLATFACEAAAVNCAAMGAAQAMRRGAAPFEIAAAKLRANRAIGIATAAAHQAHGAIGFTEEYPLHPLTRRLWAWRSEFGGDSHWAAVLGGAVCAAGADRFWPDLTALTG